MIVAKAQTFWRLRDHPWVQWETLKNLNNPQQTNASPRIFNASGGLMIIRKTPTRKAMKANEFPQLSLLSLDGTGEGSERTISFFSSCWSPHMQSPVALWTPLCYRRGVGCPQLSEARLTTGPFHSLSLRYHKTCSASSVWLANYIVAQF